MAGDRVIHKKVEVVENTTETGASTRRKVTFRGKDTEGTLGTAAFNVG